jgi:putative ABC transport system permease protein
VNWLESFMQDLRYGLRQLRQSPGFALVAVMSIALGIGANTAIFQLVDAVRLRTLRVERPEELLSIAFAPGSEKGGLYYSRSAEFTYAQWEQIRAQQQSFTGVLAWSAARFNLATSGEARYAEGLYVSGEFFRSLGVNPLLGRAFSADDDGEACISPGAVLSYAFWQREFAADAGVLGRMVNLDGHPFPVVGVTPPSFFGVEVGTRYDVAIPLCADRLLSRDGRGHIPVRRDWWLSMMGRLKPGWTAQRAIAHLQVLSPGIMQATLPPNYQPDAAKRFLANRLVATEAGTGVSFLRHEYERPLWLLLATTGLVLLIACANLANLLLARASVREREMAVRLAIGASRGRLVRQLLAESLLLALIGAALGTALAQVLSRALIAFLSTPNNPLFVGLGVDGRVLGFTAVLAAATCILFGLAPALRATHLAPAAAMRSGGRGTTAGCERFGLRRGLVATQIALSLVLLVGALLFVRSLHNLSVADTGFQTEGVLAINLDLRRAGYTKERRPALYHDLLQHLTAWPGVSSAAQVLDTPISGSGLDDTVIPEGETASASGKDSHFSLVGPGYFRTMGTALIAGRDFNDHDTLSSPKVAIVNEAFARKFFAGSNPVGRTFRIRASAGEPDPVYQIVGLVRNTKYYTLRENFAPVSFLPMAQDTEFGTAPATFVLHTNAPMGELIAAVKTAVAEVSPGIGIEFHVLAVQLRDSLLRERLMATLSGAFGLLAGLLATLGLYGVMAYMVSRRRNEIGVRMALGADRGQVLGLVLREAGLVLTVGLTVGALLALWAGRAAATLLFGLQPHDPRTLLAAMALLTVVTLAASYGPARHAAALDPMVALRDE